MKRGPDPDERPQTPEERYAEIMRRIKAGSPPKAPRHPLDQVLDDLNVLEVLEQRSPGKDASVMLYGPQHFKGSNWRSVLVWYREKGYRRYQKLWLYGLWAQEKPEGILLILGQRHLQYRAPVYNAEAYHKLIKQGFATYYEDPGSPPGTADQIHWQHSYNEAERIILRQEIAGHITQWGDGLRR